MNNDLAKPVLISILAFFVASITWSQSVAADEADAETAAEEGSESVIEENIVDRSSMEPVFVCQVWTNTSSSICSVTDNTMSFKDAASPGYYFRIVRELNCVFVDTFRL